MQAARPLAREPVRARNRPFGVLAIVALQLLDVLILSLQIGVAWGGLPGVHLPSSIDPQLIVPINGLIITLLLITMVGLLRLRRWAWLLTMILTGLSLLLRLVAYLQGAAPALPLLVGVLTVFYLNQRTVQQRFTHRASGTKGGA